MGSSTPVLLGGGAGALGQRPEGQSVSLSFAQLVLMTVLMIVCFTYYFDYV